MSTLTLTATKRTQVGKGASRRLRHAGKMPAVIYGSGEPVSVELEHRLIVRAQEEKSFYTDALELDVDGEKVKVIVKDMQRHPFKPVVMHVDFQRVAADETVA